MTLPAIKIYYFFLLNLVPALRSDFGVDGGLSLKQIFCWSWWSLHQIPILSREGTITDTTYRVIKPLSQLIKWDTFNPLIPSFNGKLQLHSYRMSALRYKGHMKREVRMKHEEESTTRTIKMKFCMTILDFWGTAQNFHSWFVEIIVFQLSFSVSKLDYCINYLRLYNDEPTKFLTIF